MLTPTNPNSSVHFEPIAPNQFQSNEASRRKERVGQTRYKNLLNFLSGIGQNCDNECISDSGKVIQVKKFQAALSKLTQIQHDQKFSTILNGLKDLTQDENQIKAIYKARKDYSERFKKMGIDTSELKNLTSFSALMKKINDGETNLLVPSWTLIKAGLKIIPLIDDAILFKEIKEAHSAYLLWPITAPRLSIVNAATIFTKSERQSYLQELKKYDLSLQKYIQEHATKMDTQTWEALHMALIKFEEFEETKKAAQYERKIKESFVSPSIENHSTSVSLQSAFDFPPLTNQSPDPSYTLESEGISETQKSPDTTPSLNDKIFCQRDSELLPKPDFSLLNEGKTQEIYDIHSQRLLYQTNVNLGGYVNTVPSLNRKRYSEEASGWFPEPDEFEDALMKKTKKS